MTELCIVFLKGALLGFSLAMVLGPIGILCIQQTLSRSLWAGLAVGLGAATADAIYGTIGGLGLTVITDFLINQKKWLQLIGGLFLCYLGIRALLSKPHQETTPETAVHGSLYSLYLSTVFLTLANPITILTFTAFLAGLGITAHGSSLTFGFILFSSVFLGSLAWWIILTSSLTLLRHRISMKILNKINMIAGIVMLGFGAAALIMVAV
jgi:threonine/homoserine/homoserine lactone efflux protein